MYSQRLVIAQVVQKGGASGGGGGGGIFISGTHHSVPDPRQNNRAFACILSPRKQRPFWCKASIDVRCAPK